MSSVGTMTEILFVSRTKQQRWWQLKMKEKINLKAVNIHLKKEPLIAVTVFTIELLPHNRTVYRLCGRYNNTSSGSGREARRFVTDTDSRMELGRREEAVTVMVECDNREAVGHFIFIRDDRKKEDYFTICEVEVFALNSNPDGESIF